MKFGKEPKTNKNSQSREKFEEKRKMQTGRGFQREWWSEFAWLDCDEE